MVKKTRTRSEPTRPAIAEAQRDVDDGIRRRVDRSGVARILNCVPEPDTKKDWPAEAAFDARLVAAAPIPASRDLRDTWWDVGNQHDTGSCVGWATADGVLRWHFVKAGRLEKDRHLSVRYVWMAAKETDEYTTRPTTFIERNGTKLKAALDIARKFGVVLEALVPFASAKLYDGDETTFYAVASQRRIASYFKLATGAAGKIAAWKKWLATVGPILTRFDVDDTWLHVGNDGNLDKYKPETAGGGHAVAVVGYTPTHFIIRNSWGKTWGDDGFGYASAQYTLAAFDNAYGVVVG